jgi:aarF domain-containing kinase
MVAKFTKMRGAALKLGQMFSIQDTQMLPPDLGEILLKVHDSANYMPEWQMEQVMSTELGHDWKSHFKDFDPIPIAAASIGQVHAATLRSTNIPLAIKVQYPGVAKSIDSDLDNLKTLVMFGSLLPKGLYLDNTIKVMRRELAWECDYEREAECMSRFGELLRGSDVYKVPRVIGDLSTKMVLTSERLGGEPLSRAVEYEQSMRDKIGDNLLRLCLRELFSWRLMQTDPNWSNFFYNKHTSMIELLDFGATRSFDKRFLDLYLHVLRSASEENRDAVAYWSTELGFLTGYETELMREAHIDSVMALGEPFRRNTPDIYDFGIQTVTNRVRDNISIMLKHRLTPPHDETYSLHRKLSGVFLLCAKLRAKMDTKKLFAEETQGYTFGQFEMS